MQHAEDDPGQAATADDLGAFTEDALSEDDAVAACDDADEPSAAPSPAAS